MNKAAFLDRDGTINVEKNYLYRVEDFEYLDGAIEGLRYLQSLGYLLVIITNQSGIARGLYTEEDYRKLNEWMLADLRKKGIYIAGTYYCPHLPGGAVKEYDKICNCRKPGTALFYMAASELDIDLKRSIAIGDRERDLCICNEREMVGYLLGNVQTSKQFHTCNTWEDIINCVKE